jgi:hypothetical protein
MWAAEPRGSAAHSFLLLQTGDEALRAAVGIAECRQFLVTGGKRTERRDIVDAAWLVEAAV